MEHDTLLLFRIKIPPNVVEKLYIFSQVRFLLEVKSTSITLTLSNLLEITTLLSC